MKLLASAALALVLTACLQAADTPKVGEKAPAFEGKDQDGKTWKLAELAGRNFVLLYFYPKDDTPGCTKQACGLRDRMTELHKDGVVVVGVSFDSPESHRAFREKHNLNFTLLTDPDGRIADAYGTRVSGKNLARRVSILIGPDGKVLAVTDTPSADTHLNEMKDAIAKATKK